ncbi:Alanine dehydrogenase (plasmid) [Caballeronia sp. SBC1]|uniref:alanine dehydrogenase n=1 Tax=unclassified Caballeronia TaxID=2646786 RepID=UPI0013E1E519|nr:MULTISPECIES: alanine dehydrogenase [unclassified Caballeronia]QIE25751.1 Alanine dehydrogenase [Caballeronia sp. SBC2]QIN64936.1 Alanine dehydrogenase [Caballeronia sp. SBC1]
MRIGLPKEIKNHEYRVGLTPAGVRELVSHGHEVVVQTAAGAEIGLSDDAYKAAGAAVVDTAQEVFERAEMIIKVKEPQPAECAMLRAGQILYTYLHLAPDPEQTRALIDSKAVCIAYETITGPGGGLPLLAPMSEVAGRMSIQAGAAHLEKSKGGMALLLGGVPGVAPGHVVIIGAGVVGTNALQIAVGMGARVTIIDKNLERLRALDVIYGNRVTTLCSNVQTIEDSAHAADLLIGGVLIPGAAAPKLVTRDMISRMKPGAVVVDVAIDQGGCFETSRPTTHTDPTFIVDNVVHYCVANMPGAVARTSTFALTNATIGHALAIADKGWRRALSNDPHLRAGLNVCEGNVTYKAVARDLGFAYVPAESLLT